jgi:serine/threonine protein kinase/tetratricopeptide (TPR) repeat protein
VIAALERYSAAARAGNKPDRGAFLAAHPDLAPALTACLDGLEFVADALPGLSGIGQDTPEADDVLPAQPLGDFQIVRELGRGGMGVVYEAVQLSLGRRVALKVLPLAAALDAKHLQRFRNEAQAAAQLHHTNIVPVFGVGCERGVHYYAMQFIAGQTLAKVIADLRMQIAESHKRPGEVDSHAIVSTPPVAALSTEGSTKDSAFFRTVANLGVQAAEALEHAHQLGIIHRDIKPANLLIQHQYEPRASASGALRLWVTDFGLAHCQSQPGLTMSGDLLGTLRYMSPEQALAKPLLVDHRTDVYSLGVTLYELLTLQPALGGKDRQELLGQIAWEEPRPPRRVRKGIPADLETIVLKAIAKNPEDRYGTAQELADDLERFLNDVPVKARRPTPLQRAAKWGRRHRTVVRAAAVVMALAVVALAASTLLIWRAKEETDAALVKARQQERLADENGARAEEQRRQAEAAYRAEKEQRRQAEANARLAWQAFSDELFSQALELWGAGRPELAEARRKALSEALRFYEAFAKENHDNPALRVETAKAYRRIGDIRSRFDQHARAEEAYRQALDLLCVSPPASSKGVGAIDSSVSRPESSKGVEAFCTPVSVRHDVAATYNNLGRLLEHIGRLTQAEQAYRRALDLCEQFVADSPSAAARESLAIARLNLGNVLVQTGQTRKAEDIFRQAVAAQQKLVGEFPDVAAYKRELASSQNSLGFVLWTYRRSKDAEPLFRAARDLLQPLTTDFTDPTCQAKLAGTLQNLGILLAGTGRPREAEAAHHEALTIFEKLAADFSIVPNHRHDLARSRIYLAELRLGAGQPRDAEQALSQAVNALETLATEFPAVPRFRETLAAAHEHRSTLWESGGKIREAEQASRRALLLRRQLAESVPNAPLYRSFQGIAHHNLGILLQNTGRPKEAEADYGQGLVLLEKLVGDFPDEPDYQHRLAALQNSLGTLFQATDRPQQAEAAYRRALTILEKLADEFPSDAGHRRTLAIGYLNLGNLHTLARRPQEAALAYRQGLKIESANAALCDALAWHLTTNPDPQGTGASEAVGLARRAVELAPQSGPYWKTLAMARGGAGDYQGVIEAFEKSMELRKGGDGFDWFYLAGAHAQLGDKEKARQCYERGVRWMEENRPEDQILRRFRAKIEQMLNRSEKK